MGLAGHLWFLSDDQPRVNKCSDLLATGHLVEATLFMDSLNVPTRSYDRPFSTQSGDTVLNSSGNPFYEWFGIQMDSELRLGENEAEGPYQLAVLSDDGAILQIDDTGTGFETLVSADTVQPSTFKCAGRVVNMTRDSSFPIRVQYFQGPRYHIALILMWRPYTGSLSDTACGASGNSKFFDYTQIPSAPTAYYNGMLARGWKPLDAANYALPRAIAENPCKAADPVNTTITAYAPGLNVTNQTEVSFSFASNYNDSTFDCSLNGAKPTACTSPIVYTGLADGSYRFEVHASRDGVRDATGAVHNFRIDTIPPLVTFVSTTTTQTSIQIDWATSEPTTAYLDWGTTPLATNHIDETVDYQSTRTMILNGLTPSTVYYFFVGGRDEAGNTFRSNRFSSATRR
jgi:hypothetical protein